MYCGVDDIRAEGLVVGAEYMVEDANGCEEVNVLEILNGQRLRTVAPLARTYAGGRLRRTNWQTLGIDGISAKAGIGAVYWSKPLSLGEQTVSNYIHILRDNGPGVLTLRYRAASGSPSAWTTLSPDISESSGTNDRYLRYTFPALTGDLLLKVVCSAAEVYVRHIVTHVPRHRTGGTWDSSGYKIADGRDISAIFARELNITGAPSDNALLSDVGFELHGGVLGVTKIYSHALADEAAARIAGDAALTQALAEETAARLAADATEAGTRLNRDNELAQAISDEAGARVAADSGLESLIYGRTPYATTAAPGVIRIATDPEAEAGVAQNICVTPAQLKRFSGGDTVRKSIHIENMIIGTYQTLTIPVSLSFGTSVNVFVYARSTCVGDVSAVVSGEPINVPLLNLGVNAAAGDSGYEYVTNIFNYTVIDGVISALFIRYSNSAMN